MLGQIAVGWQAGLRGHCHLASNLVNDDTSNEQMLISWGTPVSSLASDLSLYYVIAAQNENLWIVQIGTSK